MMMMMMNIITRNNHKLSKRISTSMIQAKWRVHIFTQMVLRLRILFVRYGTLRIRFQISIKDSETLRFNIVRSILYVFPLIFVRFVDCSRPEAKLFQRSVRLYRWAAKRPSINPASIVREFAFYEKKIEHSEIFYEF